MNSTQRETLLKGKTKMQKQITISQAKTWIENSIPGIKIWDMRDIPYGKSNRLEITRGESGLSLEEIEKRLSRFFSVSRNSNQLEIQFANDPGTTGEAAFAQAMKT